MWALKVDINLLSQHCKPADWLADWLTDWLRHLCTQGTQTLEHLRHYKDTWALKTLEGHVSIPTLRVLGHLVHSGTRRALGHSRHLGNWGTWALKGHFGTRALKALGLLGTWTFRHLGTRRAYGHSGTWALGHWRHSRHFIYLNFCIILMKALFFPFLSLQLLGFFLLNFF